MKPTSYLHDFLMSVPSPAIYTIVGLLGSAMVMKATGIDFAVTVTQKGSQIGIADANLPDTQAISGMISNVDVRRAAIEATIHSLAEWEKAIRFDDDIDVQATRNAMYGSLPAFSSQLEEFISMGEQQKLNSSRM